MAGKIELGYQELYKVFT